MTNAARRYRKHGVIPNAWKGSNRGVAALGVVTPPSKGRCNMTGPNPEARGKHGVFRSRFAFTRRLLSNVRKGPRITTGKGALHPSRYLMRPQWRSIRALGTNRITRNHFPRDFAIRSNPHVLYYKKSVNTGISCWGYVNGFTRVAAIECFKPLSCLAMGPIFS